MLLKSISFHLFYFIYQLILRIITFFIFLKNKKELLYRKGKLGRKVDYWFHAASVGEVKLIDQFNFLNNSKIAITVMTQTGFETAKKLFKDADIYFVPYDISNYINSFLKRIKPDKVILFETELWPSIILETKKYGAELYLFYGRISDNSFKNYKYFRFFLSILFSCFNGIYARSEEDKLKLKKLGAKKVKLIPSLKIPTNINYSSDDILHLIQKNKKIIVAGSCHFKEVDILLNKYDPEKYQLIIVPRHLENCIKISKKLKELKLSYSLYTDNKKTDILIVNKMGILMKFYKISDVSFVGGSLIDIGGHNMMEPAVFGKPVIFGKYIQNFRFQSLYLEKNKLGFQIKNNFWEKIEEILNIKNKQSFIDIQKKILTLKGKDSKNYTKILKKKLKRKKILIIRFSALGDCVMTLPILNELSKYCNIDVLTKSIFLDVFKNVEINNIYTANNYSNILKLISELINNNYDIVLDLHKNGKSLFTSLFFSNVLRYNKNAVIRRLSTFSFIQTKTFSVIDSYSNLAKKVCKDYNNYKFLNSEKGIKTAVFSCGAAYITKTLIPENYRYIAERLYEKNYKIVFIGSTNDKEITDKVISELKIPYINKIGKTTINDVFKIIKNCSVFIGNDTGPMHIAEIYNKPLLTFFGPTSKELGFYPVNSNALIAEKTLNCRPCSIHGEKKCKYNIRKCMIYKNEELEKYIKKLLLYI